MLYRTEVNVICLFILIWITFRSKMLSDKQTRKLMFQRVITHTILLLGIDTLLFFTNGNTISGFYAINWILSLLYYTLNCLVAFFWVQYVLYYIYQNQNLVNTFNYIAGPILAVYNIIALSSPVTHLVFYIDPNTNQLHKGVLYALEVMTIYGFFTFSSAVALASLFSKKNQAVYYHKYVTFFSFLFFPLAGGILHMIFPHANIVWQGLTLGFLLVYIEFQFDLISRDSLTGLNNRRAFEQRLKQLGEDETDSKRPYHIFMIDINFFKDINDKYGHPEGDKALVCTAEILQKVVGSSNAFISRYGGDEFALIYSCSLQEAGNLRIKLYKEFDDFNKSALYPYRISISVGYACINGSGKKAVSEAVKKADAELYTEKEFMHQALEQVDHLMNNS